MKVFIDTEYHCHTTNPDGTFREVEHPLFDNKCDTFIEGYCYDDSKGYVQVYPWEPYSELDNAQREYERKLLAEYEAELSDMKNALNTLGVTVNESVD